MWKVRIAVFSYAFIAFIRFFGSLAIMFPAESSWFKWFRLGVFALQLGVWCKIRTKPFHPLEAIVVALILGVGLSGVIFSEGQNGVSFFSYMVTSFGAYLIIREVLAVQELAKPLLRGFDIINSCFLIGSFGIEYFFREMGFKNGDFCGSERWCGFTENPNILAWFSLVMLAFSVRSGRDFLVLRGMNIALATVLIVLSASRTAHLGLVFFCLGILFFKFFQQSLRRSKKIFIVAILVGMALTTFFQVSLLHRESFTALSRASQDFLGRPPIASPIEPRNEIGQWAWEKFWASPWVGHGFVVNEKIPLSGGFAHITPIDNMYLNLASSYGILGLGACVLVLWAIYCFAWKVRETYTGLAALWLVLPPLLVFEDYVLGLSLFLIVMGFFTKEPP